jgi:TetR/AcrR family transcriptional regulator, tetracycline repressor protein
MPRSVRVARSLAARSLLSVVRSIDPGTSSSDPESAKALPATVFRPMEITLNALEGAGFSPDDGLRAYYPFMTFTLGQASYQIKGWARGVDAAAAISDGRIDQATFPAVIQASAQRDWDFDKSFEFGLSIILEGLTARAPRR